MQNIIRRHIETITYSVYPEHTDERYIAYGSDGDDMPIYIFERETGILLDSYYEEVDLMYNDIEFECNGRKLTISRYR